MTNSVEDRTLKIYCWDHNVIGSDSLMGVIIIDLKKIATNTEQWFKVAPREGHADIVSGEIKLKIVHVRYRILS
jgi:hypothetical protein